MSEEAGGIPPGADVTFVQYLLPGLRSGEVTVTAVQAVDAAGQGETFVAAQRLSVAGPRYRLGTGDVASVFPPPGSQGEFSSVLPHVVLSAPTLPWQRSPGTVMPGEEPSVPTGGAAAATWLALLPFCALDPPPAPRQATVGELVSSGSVFSPPRAPEDGESDGDPVTVIDVPAALFQQVAPAPADLDWLAHVRQVDVAAKPAGDAPPPAVYGVVVGNRLAVPGQATTAYLVSLEGWAPYLPTEDGTPSPYLPPQTETMRLVVLHQWTYSAVDLQQSFTGLLTAVDLSPSGVRLPALDVPLAGVPEAGVPAGDPAAEAAVENAFGLGYTGMDHALVDGDATVSWYRGPLQPPRPGGDAPPPFVSPPYAAASPLLRYDPTTGMFDVTYAAAWELGRLLALRDNAYATALYRWKLTQTQRAVNALEEALLDETLVGVAGLAPGGDRHARFVAAAAGVAGPAAARVTADSNP